MTISIGFQIGWKYLVAGDPWHAIKFAKYIGEPGTSPISTYPYPIFWGYVSSGLSVLSGVPYINVNTLLAPFSYLFITSVYLFIKSILINFKTKYSVLATILVAMFSGFLATPTIPSLVFVGEFYFIFKSYSYILFFMGLALFFIIINNKSPNNIQSSRFSIPEKSKFIVLSSIFLVLSFMTYVFPFMLSFLFLLIYCFFQEKNKKNQSFKYLLYFTFSVIFFFMIFDIILEFYLSHLLKHYVLLFFSNHPISNILRFMPPQLLTYPCFILLFFALLTINIKIFYKIRLNNRVFQNIRSNQKRIFKLFILIFTVCLFIEFILLGMKYFIPKFGLGKDFFLFLYFNKIFLSIGLIGIIGVYSSIYIYTKYKKLYITLLLWILSSIIGASLVFYIDWFVNYRFTPQTFLENSNSIIWFNEIWIFSIPPLCIMSSFGMFELLNKIKKYEFFTRNKFSTPIFKVLISFSLLSFSFSGIIISGVINGNANYRYSDSRVETLGWISENIPAYSGILVIDNFFMGGGIHSITFVSQYYLYDIFDETYNETLYIQQIRTLRENNIRYLEVSQLFLTFFPEISDFINDYLIPNFYNQSLYQNGEIAIYKTPIDF
jgi:hypothetical protein